MDRIVNPTSDIFVRYLLGSPENTDILLDFINTVLLDSGFKPAVRLKIMNPFNLKTYSESKESILDVKAEDENSRIFDVEIQVLGDSRYVKRSLYYWSKNYHQQLKEGDRYDRLNPVICVNILDFTLFTEIKKAHSCFLATEKDENEFVLTDDFQIHFFELPKMDVENKKSLSNRMEKWAYFFKKEGLLNEEEEMKILIGNDPVMENAHNSYKKFTADDELLQVYEAREKRLRDEASRLAAAEEKGIQKGIQRGLHSTAKKMKELGIATDIICKSTGLSEDDLKNI